MELYERFVLCLYDLSGLFFPRVCSGCNEELSHSELSVCLSCLEAIPQTYFHQTPTNNELFLKFYGKIPLSGAMACYYFDKDSRLQNIIHALKYHGVASVGRDIGFYYGSQRLTKANFPSDSVLIPMPLHKAKERMRGYNQAERFAKGLAESLKIPLRTDILKRVRFTETQTLKNKEERWQNVKEAFQTRGKSPNTVCLVDDVITTGATVESAVTALLQGGAKEVYIIAIAMAR